MYLTPLVILWTFLSVFLWEHEIKKSTQPKTYMERKTDKWPVFYIEREAYIFKYIYIK